MYKASGAAKRGRVKMKRRERRGEKKRNEGKKEK